MQPDAQTQATASSRIMLYHGSNVEIPRPDISFNTGFADLGKGFYLTDSHDVARTRAYLRMRQTRSETAAISAFELDESLVPWAVWDAGLPTLEDGESLAVPGGVVLEAATLDPAAPGAAAFDPAAPGAAAPTEAAQDCPFGLRFSPTPAGLEAWATYITKCRRGLTEVPGLGDPVAVRAWIATEEIEMVWSGFATASEVAAILDPAKMTVQYCLRDQRFIDQALHFVDSEIVEF